MIIHHSKCIQTKNLHFIREYKSVKIENLDVGETNYNVRCPYDIPDGYVIAAVECYCSAGCSASYGGYNVPELTAMVTNNTTITRSPYVNWNVLLVKEELMEYRS